MSESKKEKEGFIMMNRMIGLRVVALLILICLMVSPVAIAYEELAKGSKGGMVIALQERLNELGYSVGTADGDFGGKTENAVKQYQQDNGLEVTGIVDEVTYLHIFDIMVDMNEDVVQEVEEVALYLIHSDAGYGYCNDAGEIVIPCQWEMAKPFENGMAIVQQNSLYGYINTSGELVIPCEWELAYPFEDGYAEVYDRTRGFTAIYDRNGKQIIEPADYFNGSNASDGIFIYQDTERDSIIVAINLETGKTLFEIDGHILDDSAARFSDDVFGILDYQKDISYYVDRNGNKVLELKNMNDYFMSDFSEGYALITETESGKYKSGFIDKEGNIVIDCEWYCYYSGGFHDGRVIVSKNNDNGREEGPYGYINTSGELVIPFQFKDASIFSEGLAAVQDDTGLWGFIDVDGNVVIDFLYNEVENFRNGYSLVTKGNDKYYIAPKGEIAFPFVAGDDIGRLTATATPIPTVTPQPTATPKPTATPMPDSELRKLYGIYSSYGKSYRVTIEEYALHLLEDSLLNPQSLQVFETKVAFESLKVNGNEVANCYTALVSIEYSAMNRMGGYTRDYYIAPINFVVSGDMFHIMG